MPSIPNSLTMQRRFAGGDYFSPAQEIGPYDLADLTNAYTYAGIIQSRLGKVACFVSPPSSNPSYGGWAFLRSDGTTSIVFVNNGKLYHSVPGPLPMTSAEIQIGGSVSFALSSANARAAHIGKYLYIVDGVVSLYRVNINADNSYTAVAVTALTPPSVPTSPALSYTTIDAFTSTTGWTADYIAGTAAAKTVTGVTNATPMVATSTSHGYAAGDVVNVTAVTGNTAANGTWRVGTTAANTFTLLYMDGTNTTGNGAYVSGGSAVRLGTTTSLSTVGATNLLPQAGQYVSWSSVGSPGGGWTNGVGPLDTPRGSFDTTATMPGSPSDFDPGVKYIQMDNPPSSFSLTTAVANAQLVNDTTRYATHFLVQLAMIASYSSDSIDVAVSAYSDTAGANLIATRSVNLLATSTGYHLTTLSNIVSFGDVSTAIRSIGVSYTAGAQNHAGDNGPWISRLALYPIVGNGSTTAASVAYAVGASGQVTVDAKLLSPLNVAPMVSTAPVAGLHLTKDLIASGATAKTITGAADSGGVLQVTSASHGYSNGDTVIIHDVLGNTAANGVFYVGGVATNTFKLYTDSGLTLGVVTNSPYISGGTAIKALPTSFASYSHTAIVVRPISTITGQRFRLGLTNTTGTGLTNEATLQPDGVTYAIDISSLTSAQLANIAQVVVVILSDIAITTSSGALFAMGPFTSAGNLTIGGVDYVYVAVEGQDTSVDTSGASTGVTTDGTVLSDPSAPTTPALTPTVTQAQDSMSAAAWTNSAANLVLFYRFGGVLPTGNTPYTNYALVATCPRWTGGTYGRTGWTWSGTTGTWTTTDGYCTWNPTTRVFTDNTPDLALVGADVLVRGRTAPPVGATDVAGYANRVVLSKDSTVYISNLLTTDAAAGLYYPSTVDVNDPNAVIKGAQIPVFSNSGDKINALAPTDNSLLVFKSKSVSVLTGTDPVSGFQVDTHVKDAGVGLTASRGWAMYYNHAMFLGPNAVYQYVGNLPPVNISLKIEPLIAPGQTGGMAITASAYAGASMRFAQQRLWLFMPVAGGSVNSVAYMFDTHRYTPQEPPSGWCRFTNFGVTGAVSLSGGNDTDDLYFLGNTGNLLKYTGNFDVNSLTAVTAASNATPIAITSASHGLSSGDRVYVTGVGGNTAANGTFYATVSDSSHFTLYSDSARAVGVAGNGSYTSGGACGKMVAIAGAITSRGMMQDSNDRDAWRTNRPTRAYALMSTAESTSVTMTLTASGYATTATSTWTVNGSLVDMRWKVPSEVRGNAVQVGLSWSAYAQVTVTALGIEGAEGSIKGST